MILAHLNNRMTFNIEKMFPEVEFACSGWNMLSASYGKQAIISKKKKKEKMLSQFKARFLRLGKCFWHDFLSQNVNWAKNHKKVFQCDKLELYRTLLFWLKLRLGYRRPGNATEGPSMLLTEGQLGMTEGPSALLTEGQLKNPLLFLPIRNPDLR